MRTSVLTVTMMALLLTAVMPAATQSFVVPDAPDLLIKTRRTYARTSPETSFTDVLYIKGARQRHETFYALYRGWVLITQCDERRTLELNGGKRLYAYEPITEASSLVIQLGGPAAASKPGPGAALDVTDTGERRAFGSHSARHVITTRTSRWDLPVMHAATEEVDGWYIDVPDAHCRPAGARMAAFWAQGGGHVRLERWADPGRGQPIEETYRIRQGTTQTIISKVELVEVSEASLDDALFTVPPGYLPALPRPYGGYDFTKPDTVINRLTSYGDVIVNWANSWFSARPGY